MNDDIGMHPALQRILDRESIRDALFRYSRGVDRGDWDLVRTAYHPDAIDEHGDYDGGIDGLIDWLDARFAGVDNSAHFLGNCLIESIGADEAFVETYFVSSRLVAPSGPASERTRAGDALCRQAWGRYVDRFERRDGEWRIARRKVVLDSRFTSVAIGGVRDDARSWGTRDATDALYAERSAILDGRDDSEDEEA